MGFGTGGQPHSRRGHSANRRGRDEAQPLIAEGRGGAISASTRRHGQGRLMRYAAASRFRPACSAPWRSLGTWPGALKRTGHRTQPTLGRGRIECSFRAETLYARHVPKTKWVDRQIDDALVMVSTAAATAYAHRQARRHLPKAVVAGALVAALGTAAAVAAAGLGILGVSGAGAFWYRRKKQAAASTGWPTSVPQ